MKKIIFILFVCLFFQAGFAPAARAADKKLQVVTTLFPIYDMARAIGGDRADVSLLLPPGTEPHYFEPTARDIAALNRSDIFIYVNDQMEIWAKRIINQLQQNKKNVIINASQHITPLDPAHPASPDKKNNHAATPLTEFDSHVWLDMNNTKIMAQNIADGFALVDAAHASMYQQRAEQYQQKLIAMDLKYKKTIATCQSKKIIYGGHYAFGYLAHAYGLTYDAVNSFNSEAEPTMQNMKKMIDKIKKNNIRVVFYEKLSEPKIAMTLAHETNATILPLSSGDNIAKMDMENNITFLQIMEQNLNSLAVGLSCKKN